MKKKLTGLLFFTLPSAKLATAVSASLRTPVQAVDETSPGLRIDADRRVLGWLDREVELTPLEYDFLQCLVEVPGRVWTYEKLHLRVWGNGHVGRGSDIHSIVRRVRGKLSWLGAVAKIQVIRGVGIRLAS